MKKIILLLLAVVVIGGLFFGLKLSQDRQSAHNKTSGPVTRNFTLEVQDGELVGGPRTLTVNEGDTVNITVTSNKDDEMHLHGYDKEVELTAGKPSTLSFTANLTGRFDVELHHVDKTIFALEVRPK